VSPARGCHTLKGKDVHLQDPKLDPKHQSQGACAQSWIEVPNALAHTILALLREVATVILDAHGLGAQRAEVCRFHIGKRGPLRTPGSLALGRLAVVKSYRQLASHDPSYSLIEVIKHT
jgi:hypothetical protein